MENMVINTEEYYLFPGFFWNCENIETASQQNKSLHIVEKPMGTKKNS